MAKKYPDDLSKEMNVLSLNKVGLEEVKMDDTQKKLNKIKTDYESIFSWDIKQLTGINQNLMLNLIDRIKEKCEMIVDKDNAFNLNRFYLQLITGYELYLCESYDESLSEIESIVKFLESCVFDEVNEQYSDACNHIARASNAYIALTLNRDSEKIMKDIKPIYNLNRAEKAAICAIKARVFMEYPPIGNDIALKFANEARNLHSTEPEWLIIWLKAKGRVRRYYDRFKMPDKSEIDVAEMLSTTKTKPRSLIQASKLYMETAFIHKLNHKQEESNKHYKFSSDLTLKAIELSKDDIKKLHSCLMTYIDYPKEFQFKTVIEEVIQKLVNVKNSLVDQVLGKYYLKHEKNYEKAKLYLSRGMAAGYFSSSLQLIKVECLLKPVEEFPLVQTLNMIYEVFPSPKRRLIVLSQIIMYYYYCENDRKKMMHYLKLYMDQDIDDTIKKRHLIFAFPLYKVNGIFKTKQFLNVLSVELNNISKHHKWSKEEKEIIDDTCVRFNKMSKSRIYGDNNANGVYPNKKPYNNKNNEYNWRNQQSDSSKHYINNNDFQHPRSKYIGQTRDNTKNIASNKTLPVHQNRETDNFTKPSKTGLNNEKSHEAHIFMNKSNNTGKLFSNKKNNFHIASVDNDSTLTPNNNGLHYKDDTNSNWQTRQSSSQTHNNRLFQNNHNYYNNNSRNVEGDDTLTPTNNGLHYKDDTNSNWRTRQSRSQTHNNHNRCNNNSRDVQGGQNAKGRFNQSGNSKNQYDSSHNINPNNKNDDNLTPKYA